MENPSSLYRQPEDKCMKNNGNEKERIRSRWVKREIQLRGVKKKKLAKNSERREKEKLD
jgi:hypothetical protein